jgi:hypothetical protein
MIKRFWVGIFVCLSAAWPALATAPDTSLRPEPRPVVETAAPATQINARGVRVSLRPTVRPKPRPGGSPAVVRTVAKAISGVGLARSLRPKDRPRRIARRAERQQTQTQTAAVRSQPSTVTQTRRGSVCGERSIQGTTIAAIPGRLNGCGVANPVKVTSVDGVALSRPSTMDCGTAKALNSWVKTGLKPAVGRTGGGVKSLRVAAHYSCRTRNNKAGARISEHGKGRAIDISAIGLNNGSSLAVLGGWRDRKQGPILKKAHKAACGPFGTVLGPNADRYHQDHFHFDTARYRSGSYCR